MIIEFLIHKIYNDSFVNVNLFVISIIDLYNHFFH
jgi:hypothetical protein